ncbi:MAG: tyrosine-type recombinase/integrase [Spirochaetaceae bacterium]|jgi:integrase|nr:tyrosine-type recombinase/integrase [Spirochaetaceae bacterium]
MRPLKPHAPYCIYRKQTKAGYFWYVRYWDEASRKYAYIRSTGIPVKGRGGGRHDAEEAAQVMLKTIRFIPGVADKLFVQYVAEFWLPDSPYVRECSQVKKMPLSAAYIKLHRDDVKRHIEPFPGFRGITLYTLTPGIIRDWMRWAAEKGLNEGRINKVMQAMIVAIRHAVSRGELEKDPFRNIQGAPDIRREKGVLTPGEVSRLIHAPVTDPRGRLAVLLGLLCGLRLGEVRGLLWGDIGDEVIAITHNYIDGDGLKAPKLGSFGTVPIPESVQAAIEEVRIISLNPVPDALVMESIECPGQPFSKTHLEKALEKELTAIGIPGKWRPAPHPGKKLASEEAKPPEGYVNEQKRRNLTFHGLRHTFITLGRLAGISDLEIQALARHKSAAMMERYSHASQVLDFAAAREKLEKAIGG